MKIVPTRVQNFVSSPKTAAFVENTIIAVTTETILKMVGRPTFILLDKNNDKKKKNYAATKEFLYQTICLGLYLTIVGPIKKACGNLVSNLLHKNPNNAKMLDHLKNIEEETGKANKNYKNSGNLFKRILSNSGIKKDDSIDVARKTLKNIQKATKERAEDEAEIFDICKFNYGTKVNDETIAKAMNKMKEHKFKLESNGQSKYLTERFNKILQETPSNLKKTFGEIISNVNSRKFGKGVHEFGAIFGSVATLAILAPEISHYLIHPLMKALKLEKPEENIK